MLPAHLAKPAMLPNLNERVAALLGWPVKDVQSFSKPMLAEIVAGHAKATKDPNAEAIEAEIRAGHGHRFTV